MNEEGGFVALRDEPDVEFEWSLQRLAGQGKRRRADYVWRLAALCAPTQDGEERLNSSAVVAGLNHAHMVVWQMHVGARRGARIARDARYAPVYAVLGMRGGSAGHGGFAAAAQPTVVSARDTRRELAGFYAYDARQPCVLAFICVRRVFERLGLGSVLLAHYERGAAGCAAIYLAAVPPAVPWYASRGFLAVRASRREARGGREREAADPLYHTFTLPGGVTLDVDDESTLMVKALAVAPPPPPAAAAIHDEPAVDVREAHASLEAPGTEQDDASVLITPSLDGASPSAASAEEAEDDEPRAPPRASLQRELDALDREIADEERRLARNRRRRDELAAALARGARGSTALSRGSATHARDRCLADCVRTLEM